MNQFCMSQSVTSFEWSMWNFGWKWLHTKVSLNNEIVEAFILKKNQLICSVYVQLQYKTGLKLNRGNRKYMLFA